MMRIQSFLILALLLTSAACKPEAQALPAAAQETKEATSEEVPSEKNQKPQREEITKEPESTSADDYDEEKRFRERSPTGLNESYFKCLKETNYNAVYSMSCVSEEINQQDTRLNKLYRKLMEKLDKDGKNELKEAQRAWIKLSHHDGALEDHVIGNEIIENSQKHENELFRICERANVLQKYLDIVEL